MRVCECGTEFPVNPRFPGEHRFCSPRCRTRAWRRRAKVAESAQEAGPQDLSDFVAGLEAVQAYA